MSNIVAERMKSCVHVRGLEEFQEACNRTAPTDYEPIEKRLDTELLVELYASLEALRYVGKNIDRIKKHLFYGKDRGACVASPIISDDQVIHAKDNLRIDVSGISIYRLLHCVLGLATESAEACEHVQDHIYNNLNIDPLAFLKELGDSGWYTMEGCSGLEESASVMASVVIQKLRDRYPDKFVEKLAQNHDGN